MARLDILLHSFGGREIFRPDLARDISLLSDQCKNTLNIDDIYLYIIFSAVPDNICKLGKEIDTLISEITKYSYIDNIHIMLPYGGLEEIFGHLMINYIFNLLNREKRDIILSIDDDCNAGVLDFVNMIVRSNKTRMTSCIKEEYNINGVPYSKITSTCIAYEIISNYVINYTIRPGYEKRFAVYPNSGGSSIFYYIAANQHAIVKEKVLNGK